MIGQFEMTFLFKPTNPFVFIIIVFASPKLGVRSTLLALSQVCPRFLLWVVCSQLCQIRGLGALPGKGGLSPAVLEFSPQMRTLNISGVRLLVRRPYFCFTVSEQPLG